ncbi:MAG: hypothetical protein M1828_004461 [Chrysothrix sp. TS-e1954]|nr:MAG: hypothetical protein M1828_004461 [Chrysothrix sp. TS-e1954]
MLDVSDKLANGNAHGTSDATREAMQVLGLHSILYQVVVILWLFTYSDIKTILIPKIAFGLVTYLCGPVLTSNQQPTAKYALARLPNLVVWIWIHLLYCNLSNQRQPEAIEEDRVNKPWRPLPSGRISKLQTNRLLIVVTLSSIATSYFCGGLEQSIILIVGGWSYDKLGSSDSNFAVRNLHNAGGFLIFASGAANVACECPGSAIKFNDSFYQWLATIAFIVFTTVQTQDLEDQAGDSVRNRATIPLVLGDSLARWTVAIPVVCWSLFCPFFWRMSLIGSLLPTGIGTTIAARVLSLRSVNEDKKTWRLWCAWMAVMYALPFLKYHGL